MLSPDKLRKKTHEAAERIALERQREKERSRQEEEALILEAERQRVKEERTKYLRKRATRTWVEILKQSIKTASQGGRSLQLEVPLDLADVLQAEVKRLGLGSSISLKITFISNWGITLQRRLNVLVEKIRSSPYAENYVEKLAIDQLPLTKIALQNLARMVQVLLAEIEGDPEEHDFAKRGLRFLLPDEARIYINRHIKPHLIADIPGALVAHLEVSWRPRDVLRVTMSELHDVPSWLLSNGGSGLIEHIGKCMDIDADQGKNESIFELHPLPNNPDRWGDNTMTKFTHGSQPIGVSPFPPGVFAKVMGLIGFTATVDTTPESVVLTLRW